MPPVIRHRNATIYLDHSLLLDAVASETYLTSEASAGTTITVANISGFAINQVLLLEDIGNERAEIVKTHASSAPSGTTITLAAASLRTHGVGTKVRVIAFDQYELSHASTATGSKTVLTVSSGIPASGLGSGLIAIDPSRQLQSFYTVEQSTGFYFARYKNSISTAFSGYSDALRYAGWAENTVGYLIHRALRETKATLSELITRDDCYAWINEVLKIIKGKQVRWPEHSSHNYVAGQVSRGSNKITMPSDAYDTETNRSITGFRIGTGPNLDYLDPDEFDEAQGEVAVTQVTTEGAVGATTLEIDNSYDFADSGTVHVYISGTQYAITYTGVTRSATAGVLTGVPASGTGSITVTVPVDTYVWQNEEEAEPTHYTVRNGTIEWWPLADSTHDNANAYLDYDKVATSVDTDGDTIDAHRFDSVQAYLTWRVKDKKENNGKLDMQDGYYLMYKETLNDAIRTSRSGQRFPMRPRINRVQQTK